MPFASSSIQCVAAASRRSATMSSFGASARGRNTWRRGFCDRQRPDGRGGGGFVSGDSHVGAVREANYGFRQGYRGDAWVARGEHPQQPFRPRPPPFWQPRPPFHQPPPLYYGQPPPYRPSPPPRPADYRNWNLSQSLPPPHCVRFTILSYNILADYLAREHQSKLYCHIPDHILDWEWRKRKLLVEFGLWAADIMCLQEVDRFDDLEKELAVRGYTGVWKMRTGNAVDGCAIFWRTNRFHLRHEEHIEYCKLGLRDNVAQICVLESRIQNQAENMSASLHVSSDQSTGANQVVICNTHVLYNPKRGEIKLGQVRLLLDRAHAVSKIWNDAPVVICGDFNCTPKSPLYNFISERKLCLSGLARNRVSGQHSALIRTPRQYAGSVLYKGQLPLSNSRDVIVDGEQGASFSGSENRKIPDNVPQNVILTEQCDSPQRLSCGLDVTHRKEDATSVGVFQGKVQHELRESSLIELVRSIPSMFNQSSCEPNTDVYDPLICSLDLVKPSAKPDLSQELTESSTQLNKTSETLMNITPSNGTENSKTDVAVDEALLNETVLMNDCIMETSSVKTSAVIPADAEISTPGSDDNHLADLTTSHEAVLYQSTCESNLFTHSSSSLNLKFDMALKEERGKTIQDTNFTDRCSTTDSAVGIIAHNKGNVSSGDPYRNDESIASDSEGSHQSSGKCASIDGADAVQFEGHANVGPEVGTTYNVESSEGSSDPNFFKELLGIDACETQRSSSLLDCCVEAEEPIERLHISSSDTSDFYPSGVDLLENSSPSEAPQVFDQVKHFYNPYLWTPMEIEVASGNAEKTFVEHNLKLRSAYTDVEDYAGTKDLCKEPQVTIYNSLFMGTVDYIWYSEGLQTVKVLDTIPKHVLQRTPGFPTQKWGSDHLALACQLAFTKGPSST